MTELVYAPNGYDSRLDIHPPINWTERFLFNPKYYEECRFIKKYTGLCVHRIYIAEDAIYYQVFLYKGIFRKVEQKPHLAIEVVEKLVYAMGRRLTYMDGWLRMEGLP